MVRDMLDRLWRKNSDGSDRFKKAEELIAKTGPGGRMPLPEYEAYALLEAGVAVADMQRFVDAPRKELERVCNEIAVALAHDLGETRRHVDIGPQFETTIREHRPIAKLLASVGATREEFSWIQVSDLLPKIVEHLAHDWKDSFESKEKARVAFAQARNAISEMSTEHIIEKMRTHSLIPPGVSQDPAVLATELQKVHAPQSAAHGGGGKRAAAGFIALIGARFLDRIGDMNLVAYEFVKNPDAQSLQERDSFLTFGDALKKLYREGAAVGVGDPELGLMKVAFEVALGLRDVETRLKW